MSLEDQNGRLLQMKLLLQWEGQLSNKRIRELFDVSKVRASVWIRDYRENFPSHMIWHSLSKSYIANGAAYIDFSESGTDSWRRSMYRYLALVGVKASNAKVNNKIDMSNITPYSAFSPIGTPNPRLFGMLNQAIILNRQVSIIYGSLTHPEPRQLTIHPHSLVQTSQRWHVRAYSEKHNQFRDFNIGRIFQIDPLDLKAKFGESDDAAWMVQCDVRITAHPALELAQKSIVQHEYFRGYSSLVETCRGALVHYFIKEMQAATCLETQTPPDFLLAVQNIDEVKSWLL